MNKWKQILVPVATVLRNKSFESISVDHTAVEEGGLVNGVTHFKPLTKSFRYEPSKDVSWILSQKQS